MEQLIDTSPFKAVTHLGLLTTPAAALWARKSNCPRLAVVTSSHTGGPDWLGLKLYRDAGIPLPVTEGHALRRLTIDSGSEWAPKSRAPKVRWARREAVDIYRACMSSHVSRLDLLTIHVVPAWLPLFHDIGVRNIAGDGFLDPKRAAGEIKRHSCIFGRRRRPDNHFRRGQPGLSSCLAPGVARAISYRVCRQRRLSPPCDSIVTE